MAVARMRSESPALGSQPQDERQQDRKRKREAKQDGNTRERRTKRPRDIDDHAIDSERQVNQAIAHMDSALMADHLAQRTKRFRPALSVVEADDIRISSNAIRDMTTFRAVRTADNLAEFVERFGAGEGKKGAQTLSRPATANGSPHTLVIAASGLRAADLTRALRKFQSKDSMVAKLFAKHIKMKDASAMVSKTKMGFGVGTPQRISDLIDNGSLKVDTLERIVIDASHIDQKKRGILDMKEVQVPLIDLLTRPELRNRYIADSKRVDLLFF